MFLPAVGDWYAGNSFIATLWLVLMTTGKVVTQKFGRYGNVG